jgi:DNA mismatch endonuclease (patch repair protein)
VYAHPDFVFRARRLAVFVDGCFWHGCPKHGTIPKSNRDFWRAKLLANSRRDRCQRQELRRRGWTVVRIWQHELAAGNEKRLAAKLRRALGGKSDD